MDVLVFADLRDPAKERFLRAISKMPRLTLTVVLGRERFRSLLGKNFFNQKVLVFFAYEPDDLALAHSLREYLSLTRVIMILPDWDGNRVKNGLSLSPSFIANANSDFSDVVAALEKISIAEQ